MNFVKKIFNSNFIFFFVEGEEEEEDNLNEHSIAINRTLLNQAYEVILQCNIDGASVLELKKLMNVDFYLARLIVRLLEKRGLIFGRKVDDFRQHQIR